MIRTATDADFEAVAAIHVRSWQAAYGSAFPDSYLAALDVAKRAAMWRRIVSLGTAEIAVQEVEGDIAGFICIAPSRDADAESGTGEVSALHVDPGAWRSGHGRKLMDWAKDVARARGWKRVTLWVLRDNARARRFYEAVGFSTDGATHEKSFDGFVVPEVRYVWACSG
jgi:ribosomal protein S18 acetylase RimI-like enzyme